MNGLKGMPQLIQMVMQRMINSIATNRARFGNVLLSAEPMLAGLVKSNAQLLG